MTPAHKGLEHLLLLVCRDPRAGIADPYPDGMVFLARSDRDRTASGGEFHGVAYQVAKHLPKP